MQKLINKQPNLHELFNALDAVYEMTSVKEYKEKKTLLKPIHIFDNSFKSIFELFEDYGGLTYPVKFMPLHYKKLLLPKYDPKNLIICVSGGKDSTSAILHYKKLGYNIYLYHLRHYNVNTPTEYEQVENIANYFDLPLYQDTLGMKGMHEYMFEHPLKKYMLLNKALQWGILNGIGVKIAFGDFTTASLEDNNFEVCASDCIETFEVYEKIVKAVVPGFKIYKCNKNYHTAFNKFLKEPKLLELTLSCLAPFRYREYRHKLISEKYKVDLLPHRCGICWKCVTEYLFFTDHNILPFNKEYYLYCIKRLYETRRDEDGIKTYSVQSLWNNYMFYPMEKSKMYKELKLGFLVNGVVMYDGGKRFK